MTNFSRGVFQQATDNRMDCPLPLRLKQAQGIDDFVGIRCCEFGGKHVESLTIEHRGRYLLQLQTMLGYAVVEGDYVPLLGDVNRKQPATQPAKNHPA